MATYPVPNPQADDGQGRRPHFDIEASLRRYEERIYQTGLLPQGLPPQEPLTIESLLREVEKFERSRVQRRLPGDAAVTPFLEEMERLYHEDAVFHAEVYAIVETQIDLMRRENDYRITRSMYGGDYGNLVYTQEGVPATAFEAQLEDRRTFLLWEELEKRAMNKHEEQQRDEQTRICIWCGKVCESVEALEEHEDECATS